MLLFYEQNNISAIRICGRNLFLEKRFSLQILYTKPLRILSKVKPTNTQSHAQLKKIAPKHTPFSCRNHVRIEPFM